VPPPALFSGSGSNSLPKANRIRTFQYSDVGSYSNGKNDLRFGAQRIHEPLLVFEAATNQQLEQRILVPDDRALAEREAHVERRTMPAAEKVRKIRRVERELAVADVHRGP